MFTKIKRLFNQYREYIRVDLAMYGVLIILILIYAVLSVFDIL